MAKMGRVRHVHPGRRDQAHAMDVGGILGEVGRGRRAQVAKVARVGRRRVMNHACQMIR